MTNTKLPPRINQAWIDDAERNLMLQAAGEYKDARIAEIEEAKIHRAFWDRVEAFMRTNEGASVNRYPIKLTAGKKADPCTVFYSKTQNRVWSFEQAAAMADSTMATIRNTNDAFGEAIEFSANTLNNAVAKMQDAVHACGADFADVVVTDSDYEIVE